MEIISSRDAVVYNEKLFFIDEINNLLSELDYETGLIEQRNVSGIKKENIAIHWADNNEELFFGVDVIDNNLIEINLQSGDAKSFFIPYPKTSGPIYSHICIVKNEIFLIPIKMECIIIFNYLEEKFEVVEIHEGMMNKSICGCDYKNNIYIFLERCNEVWIYDTVIREWKQIRIEGLNTSITTMQIKNDTLFLLEEFGTLYLYNLKTKELTTLQYDNLGKQEKWKRIVFIQNKVMAMPGNADCFLEFDLINKTVERKDLWPKGIVFARDSERWDKFFGIAEDNDFYYFANRISDLYLRIDKDNGDFLWLKPYVGNKKQVVQDLMESGKKILYEQDGYLEAYIAIVAEL